MEYTELFDRYIDGQMEGRELEDFNMKLRTDIEFRKNLEEYIRLNNLTADIIGDIHEPDREFHVDRETDELSLKDISKYGKDKRGIPDEETAVFIKKTERAGKDFPERIRGPIRKNLPLQLGIAATVIIVILFSILLLLRNNKFSNGDLYALFYRPYSETDELMEITRSSDNFYYALKVYEAKDYARAAVLFEELSDSSELRIYAIFYSGLTFIQTGQWEQAVSKLEETIGFGESIVEKPARWYLGLCFLRIDDSKSARVQFEILASSKNEYTARSRRILRLMH